MADTTSDMTLQAENPYRFAAKRFNEMSNLLRTLRAPRQTKLVFQTLPKHMRRRAATAHPKRLPRKLRATHTSQFKKSGVPVKSKRPTRKYRRKPSNLRKEYGSRSISPKPAWLETHLWHAKRFHMITRWGYRLPWSPCDKSYRACYRATAKFCLMQDVSYMVTLQLSGHLGTLKEGFRQITASQCGLTMTAKCYLNGHREGQVFLFRANQYPLGCLGHVTFFWLPPQDDGKSTIWITVHPAFAKNVKQELIQLFGMTDQDQHSSKSDLVEMQVLDLDFNRLRLSGPLAQLVLSRALKGVTVKDREDFPLHSYLTQQIDVQRTQQEFWNKLQQCESIHEVPSHLICSVLVEDPRLNRPDGRQPIHNRDVKTDNCHITEVPACISTSPLFHRELMHSVTDNVMTQGQYSKARNTSSVIPGQRCKFEDQMQACPILLIQRPGTQTANTGRLGFNSGWDVIVPKGYGSVFWLSFVMWGARAGGLREDFNTQRESKRHSFMPDTDAGRSEALAASVTARDAYFRKPCNKRHNFIKLGVASPFLSPWRQLVREWEGPSESLHVIRDRVALAAIQRYLEGKENSLNVNIDHRESALVPVLFKMSGRGNPGANALICSPDSNDRLPTNRHSESNAPIHTEPLKRDPFEAMRRKCRLTHLQLLAKMRRKRVKAKRLLQKRSIKKVAINRPMTEQIIADQHRKMCELWLPSRVDSVRGQCSRETIGYCATADFSFTEGISSGTGYVTLKGLVQNAKRSQVLIRDTGSRQYRSARISVQQLL